MSIFRGITAEEEAASAFFYCLKNHRYNNSTKIKFNEHKYKLGLSPFLIGINKFLADTLGRNSSLLTNFRLQHIEIAGRKAIELLFYIPHLDKEARPIPPLHCIIADSESKEVCTFENELKELIEGENYKDSLKYIKDKASIRNKLLYANHSGKPKIEGNIEAYLISQKMKVMVLLTIILMIDPWEKEAGKSHFVQQALDSFLLLMNQINSDEINQPHKKIKV